MRLLLKCVVQFQASQARANGGIGHGRKANARSKENNNHRIESLPHSPERTPVSPRFYTERAPVMNIGSDVLCPASNSFFLQVTVVFFYLPKPICGQVAAVPHVLSACRRPSLDGRGDGGKPSDGGVRPRSKSRLSCLPALWPSVYGGPFPRLEIIRVPAQWELQFFEE